MIALRAAVNNLGLVIQKLKQLKLRKEKRKVWEELTMMK